MSESSPRAPSTAEELFDGHLRRLERGEPSDVDALCAAHPECGGELRRLVGVHAIVGRVLPGPLAPASEDVFASSDELLAKLRTRGARDRRYEALGEIARGGMGVVLRVRDDELRRDLAMKVALRTSGVDGSGRGDVNPEVLGRFVEEALVTSHLAHPGIVPVHEIGLRADGSVYYTMRLIEGVNLRVIFGHARARSEGWSQLRAVGVLLKVCEAMSYAHSKGVIHRDLKPANVMVGKFGEVYVMDWGLARVRGRADHHDLRIRPVDSPDRRDEAPDSPLFTMDGDVVGTPAYMSPEQARGEAERLGPRSDVYSVGAMLYELMSGCMPFVPNEAHVPSRTILARLVAGPPAPLHEIARAAPAELVAISSKAMSRNVDERYPDMQALADDLRAYVEGRVVRAYETGTWAETRKWVRRNRLLAAALVTAIVVLVAAVAASLNLAQEKRRAKKSEREQAALRTIRALQKFGDDASGPAQEWLRSARQLVRGGGTEGGGRTAGLDECRALLAEMRAAAAPASESDAEAARREHPRARALEAKRGELHWRARMLELERWPREDEVATELRERLEWAKSDAGLASIPETASEDEKREGPFTVVNRLVFRMVRPDEWRTTGSEVLALCLARQLVDSTRNGPHRRARYLDTLSFAQFRIGLLDEALVTQAAAVEDLDPIIKNDIRGNLAVLRAEVAGWRDRAEKRRLYDVLASEVARLEREIALSDRWKFDSYGSWLHGELTQLEADLVELELRIARAEQAIESDEARRAWSDAIEAIRENPKYGGLVIAPQVDLAPLGPDRESGLWEFAHLPSGERPRRDGDGDGRLELRAETGLVFVLLPAGSLPQVSGDPAGSGGTIRLEPFFLSKYEMTRQQWARLEGEWPFDFLSQQLRFPATMVDRGDCVKSLHRAGPWLMLPSEAQWEYGCRGGATSRWWTGDTVESLRGAENLRFSAEESPPPVREAGSMRPNPYGLFDVHGNVSEYCRDEPDGSRATRGDEQSHGPSWIHVQPIRGGNVLLIAEEATFAHRHDGRGRQRGSDHFGLRPARCLTP